MNDQVVKVNLVLSTSAPAVLRVSQYDVGRPFKIVILDGTNKAVLAAGTKLTLTGTKPSGLGFSMTQTLGVGGDTFSRLTVLDMTQESGRIPCEIRIVEGTNDIGTANFILAVEKTPHAEGTTDGTQETMQNLEARLQTQIDGLDDRIEALESAEESGLTAQEKSLILTLFSKAAYAEDDAQSAYDTLEGLWRVVYRTITYNLTNCTSSSSVASVENGKPYSASLSAQSGYTIQTATVTMGGADVTASVYSNGAISIPQVTGDVVITAVASKELSSITATYTQSGTVYDTDTLDSLKSDLVVTANYSDSTSETVTDYTLSGTLAEGTSTITVSYAGLTTTFSVTVYASPLLYNWDLTASLTDTKSSNVATLGGNAARTSAGLLLTEATDYAVFPNVIAANRHIEIDITSINRKGSTHGRLFCYNKGSLASPDVSCGFIYRMSQHYWAFYKTSWITTEYTDSAMFDGETATITLDSSKSMTVSLNGTDIVSSGGAINIASDDASLYIGSPSGSSIFDLAITAIRVYEDS